MRLVLFVALAFLIIGGSLLIMGAPPAHSAELPAAPKKQSCGKTVDECQKVADGLAQQVTDSQATIQKQATALANYKFLLGEANGRAAGAP